MCGIFGYAGQKKAAPIILKGLERLEYRGYDSAGIALLNHSDRVLVRKRRGKVRDLIQTVSKEALPGKIGLGHTRWATHGIPSDNNAHPHLDEQNRIAIVHNGIIENYLFLRNELEREGYLFRSETDSEVIVHLINSYCGRTGNLKDAVRKALKRVRGSYAIAAIHLDHPETIVACRKDSPLVIGLGKTENFISSDIPAVLGHTRRILFLENGDLAEVTPSSVRIVNAKGESKRPVPRRINWNVTQAEKGGFSHFMLKEIFEQPKVIAGLIQKRLRGNQVRFDELTISPSQFKRVKDVIIIACGSSYHAGLVGRYYLEEVTPYQVSVETSSEFRYRRSHIDKHTLVIVISQSGETADTLAALREAKRRGALTLAVCNVLGSTIERESDGVVYTYAGPEIAVASTKAYTAQIAMLYLFGFYLCSKVFKQRAASLKHLISEFRKAPRLMQNFLTTYKKDRKTWDKNASQFNQRYHDQLALYFKSDTEHLKRAPNAFFLYLGRHVNYPSALEGALKLKEISYISAEGYPAGEMKHGPIALIDENPWVICIAVQSKTYAKMISNIEEIRARGGIVSVIITKGDKVAKKMDLFLYIEVPKIHELFSPLLVALPLQLIAFSVAKGFGEEIDQPRNLAKSVTVE